MRVCVRAASRSDTAQARHGKFLTVVERRKDFRFFFHSSPLAAAGLEKKTRALRIRHPRFAKSWIGTVPAGRYFGNPGGTKNIQRPGKEIRFSPRGEKRDLRDRATSCTSGLAEGEPGSVYFRSWLATTATDRESRASRVHDPPLAQRTRFPRSARRSDPLRRAIRWTTRRTRLSAPSARGRRATPHHG